ncbi:MAG: YihY/virulence factor BrkB family protein [Dehalococcoidia bacterium]
MRRAAEVVVRAAKGYGADHCAVFAGGVTYFALVSLFPLTLFAMSVTGFVFQDSAEQQKLVDNLLDALPIDQASGRGDLEDVIGAVVDARGTLGIIGLLGAAYSASALFGAVRTSLNGVFKAEQKRPFFAAKAIDLAQVLVFTVLLLLSVGVTFGIAFAQRFSEDLFGEDAGWITGRTLSLAYALVPIGVSVMVFILLYTIVPARKVGRRNALIGGVVAAVLFEALKVGFAQYVANFGNYDATYGTLGFVIVLLVFFNFSAQVMLLGAEVARAGFDIDKSNDAERFKETGALLQKLGRILPPVIRARLRMAPEATVPALVPADVQQGLARPSCRSVPQLSATAEEHEPAERPGTLSGLVLVIGVVAVAILGFRKR